LPYWDYTVEGQSQIKIQDSPIFQTDTFGSIHTPRVGFNGFSYEHDLITDGAIPDGRWAYAKVRAYNPYIARYPELKNAYGFLRSNWNMNPSPFVSRFAPVKWPMASCYHFQQLLAAETVEEFTAQAPYLPHGSIHVNIGGIFGCELLQDFSDRKYIIGEYNIQHVCISWSFQIKELFRNNVMVFPEKCEYSIDNPNHINCRYKCPAGYDAVIEQLTIINKYFDAANMTQHDWHYVAKFICDGDGSKIIQGDQLESASADDPSFWVIHPVMERALHLRQVSDGFEEFEWPSDVSELCLKPECIFDNFGKDFHDICCRGHYATDATFDFVNGERSAVFGRTNLEIFIAMDAASTNYSNPYIYDSLIWRHCEDAGESIIPKFVSL